VDINVAADREQWWPGAPTIDLNPQGRTQNKKYRALVPVLPTLDRWLRAEYATFMDLKPEDRAGRGWLVNYHGRPVQDVDRAWDAMLTKLGLPKGRDLALVPVAPQRRDARAQPRRYEVGPRGLHGSQRRQPDRGLRDWRISQRRHRTDRHFTDLERLAPGALHRTCTEQPDTAAQAGVIKM
jgi:hypothetical protein